MTGRHTDALGLRIATILRQQGPTDDLQLARMLMAEGLSIEDGRFEAAIAAAGAVTVRSGEDTLLAMPVGARTDGTRARAMIETLSPVWLLVILVAVVLVAVLLLASLNTGLKGAPTLHYTPPAGAQTGG